MANLDYNEELSDTEANDGPLDDEVDEVAMREGVKRVKELLGDRTQLIAQSQIEQALWDSYYDAEKAVEILSETYAEEEARMNDAAADVLQRLGENSDKVTPKQIQDALWHYYYDIEKTVGYLDRTYINPVEKTKPKPKPKAPIECKYRRPSSSANHLSHREFSGQGRERPTSRGNPGSRETKRPRLGGFELAPRIELPPEWHFWDTPWLGVPPDRQSVLVGPPMVGGLLGGTGKPSKLQALAAARKNKKAGEKKESGDLSTTPKESTSASTSTPSKRDNIKLDIRIPSKRGPRPAAEGAQDEKISRAETSAGVSSPPKPEAESASHEPLVTGVEPCVMPQTTRPSTFAATLFGQSSSDMPTPQSYPLPYTTVPLFSAKPFLQPSPDDVVLAAQSQGSRFAGR